MTHLCQESLTRDPNLPGPRVSSGTLQDSGSSGSLLSRTRSQRLSREQLAREAILLTFSNAIPLRIDQLSRLTSAEWRRLLSWLDVSGLALYFLDRLMELELHGALPDEVISRLLENLEDNRQRTWGMIHESVAIQREFQAAGLSYAVMKGISFYPCSVPHPELRHQFDLDYLIAEECAPVARQILEHMGYRLQAMFGGCWEFKKGETPNVSAKDLYKDLPYRGVELHLEPAVSEQTSLLSRVIERRMYDITMPVFSPVDLFLGQALHALKDLCSSFSRASHLLEFYRHVLTWRDDKEFWYDLRRQAVNDRKARFAIGTVTYLITSVWGDFAPEALTTWTVDSLPSGVRLWVDRYGRSGALNRPPGTKIYLLLQKELDAEGVSAKKTVKTSLLPTQLPPPVIRALPGESLPRRLGRYRVQLRFFASRMRFHVVEGIRFALESYRWRQLRNRLP